jgi:hypothetical protein
VKGNSESVLGRWWITAEVLSGVLIVEASLSHSRNLALVVVGLCAALVIAAAASIAQKALRH